MLQRAGKSLKPMSYGPMEVLSDFADEEAIVIETPFPPDEGIAISCVGINFLGGIRRTQPSFHKIFLAVVYA
jgi:hypothetical protein